MSGGGAGSVVRVFPTGAEGLVKTQVKARIRNTDFPGKQAGLLDLQNWSNPIPPFLFSCIWPYGVLSFVDIDILVVRIMITVMYIARVGFLYGIDGMTNDTLSYSFRIT